MAKFLSKNTVEVVPMNWVLAGSSMCLWPPPETGNARVSELTQKACMPQAGWVAHPISLMKACGKL